MQIQKRKKQSIEQSVYALVENTVNRCFVFKKLGKTNINWGRILSFLIYNFMMVFLYHHIEQNLMLKTNTQTVSNAHAFAVKFSAYLKLMKTYNIPNVTHIFYRTLTYYTAASRCFGPSPIGVKGWVEGKQTRVQQFVLFLAVLYSVYAQVSEPNAKWMGALEGITDKLLAENSTAFSVFKYVDGSQIGAGLRLLTGFKTGNVPPPVQSIVAKKLRSEVYEPILNILFCMIKEGLVVVLPEGTILMKNMMEITLNKQTINK